MPGASLYLGIDIGSTASKVVILDDEKRVIGLAVYPAGAGTAGPERALENALSMAGIEEGQIVNSVATGYGRKSYKQASREMSELSCHAKGAAHLLPGTRTVIDIGGQDAKVLQVGEDGVLANFAMNDKCAAGTGRFLEVMARIAELDVSELAEVDSLSTEPVRISSTCTVFAESEVISQLANSVPIPNIIAGVHKSVADRMTGLVGRVGLREGVAMTGGTALNAGVVRALALQLNVEIQTSEYSQYCGAFGAALYAMDKKLRTP